MKNEFRKFWSDFINEDVIFSTHLKSSTHLFPSTATGREEKKEKKNKETTKVVTNEPREEGKEGQRKRMKKYKGDQWKPNCWRILPGQGREMETPVFLRHPKVHSFVTRIFWEPSLSQTPLQVMGVAALTRVQLAESRKHTGRGTFTDSMGARKEPTGC